MGDPWIQTNPKCGRFPFLTATPDDVDVQATAFHLAGIYRYTGGSRITVAQHSVVGAFMAKRHYQDHPLLPAKMLVHDSAEAVMGDMSSPLKQLCPDYKRLYSQIEPLFEERFELFWSQDPLVKEVDLRMMLTEREWCFDNPDPWLDTWNAPHLKSFEASLYEMQPWAPDEAEALWLQYFRELLPWVNW